MTKRRRRPDRRFDPAALDELDRLLSGITPATVGRLPVGLMDQLQAAAAEADQRLRGVAVSAGMHRGEVGGTPRVQARLMYAMVRHTRFWCPHIRAASPLPVVALIDAGWAGCLSCRVASGPSQLDDDPRCRLCDTASEAFHPMALAVGPVLYMVEACPPCHNELVERADP